MLRSLSLVFVLSLATACGSSLTSVPVKGGDTDRAQLAGEWKGEFEGVNNARQGTIDFNFALGRHTADAKVVMQIGGKPVQLKLAYLQVDAGTITGKIEPYVDPDCNCSVETQFEGSMSPGYIVGTYKVHVDAGGERTGSWSAERIEE